ncbi:MAG: POTRA domain-containing protein [Planctomycetota bacterium]
MRGVCVSVMAFGVLAIGFASPASAQFGGGGMGGGMGGPGGGGAGAPPADVKPKFREHIHSTDGIPLRREKGDAIVLDVRIVGNQKVGLHRIAQQLQTRKDRFYDYETVLGDVRRLNDMGSFDHVTFKLDERPGGVAVTFILHERPVITRVVYHSNRSINNRELSGRAGLEKGDPLSEFAIESARRRLIDYYREEGFNQVSILSSVGLPDDPGAVVLRINEGPKERIWDINIIGATIVSEARLKKVIQSRGRFAGVYGYFGNEADMAKIDQDVNVLATYYHNLGFLTATVGRRLKYDDDGKWVTVTYVIDEGPRFTVNDVQIIGNQFVTEESLRNRLKLKPGDMFDGTLMRRDVGELVYGYGELGYIYAEVEPKTVMRDDGNVVDLVYQIVEGDRWKVGEIRVNIDGDPHLMRETTMLNLIDLREGDFIDRRVLELNRRRLERSQLLETNPAIADPPDIRVIPRNEIEGSLR